jgi:hypothetical protein
MVLWDPICKKRYVRIRHQEKFVPIGLKCDDCNCNETTLSKYGTPRWSGDSSRRYEGRTHNNTTSEEEKQEFVKSIGNARQLT